MNFREMRAKLISSYGSFVFFPDDPEIPKLVSTKAFTHLVIDENIVLYAHKIMEEQIEDELQENYDVVYEPPQLKGEYFVSPNTRVYNLNFKFKNGFEILREAMRKPFDEELEILRKISVMAEKSFNEFMEELSIGSQEDEMANILSAILLKNGVTGFSYPTIISSKKKSKWPYPHSTEKKIEADSIVYVDASPMLYGYPYNFSRVIFTGESKEWIHALNIINSLYNDLRYVIKPGASCNFIDSQIRKIGDFPHYSVVPSGGFYQPYAPGDCILEENMIMTVVPSIYLDDGLIRVKRNIVVKRDHAEFLF